MQWTTAHAKQALSVFTSFQMEEDLFWYIPTHPDTEKTP